MTREPDGPEPRQTPVIAQNPGTERAHGTHDRLLVARFAVDDELAGDERAVVRALLATCPHCAALVGELQVVRQATAASLAPSRPRDFLITPAQAATLRPKAWQRLLARFSAPGLGVLRPLAGATLAIGIVLVGASAVVPRGDQVRLPVEEAAPVANGTFVAGDVAADAMVQGSPEADAQRVDPRTKATLDPADGIEALPLGSPDPRMLVAAPSPGPGATTTAFVTLESASPEDPVEQQSERAMASAARSAEDPVAPALFILGLLLAVVAVLVLVLGWLARRTADPLLR